jgi:CheY-like chemotaxis protein
MSARLLRFALAVPLVACWATLLPPAHGQAAKDKDSIEEYRRLFKAPTNVPEFWNAMRFEIDVGRYDLAAAHLRGLLALKPTDQQLVDLAEKEGITPILALRNIRNWSTSTSYRLTPAAIAELKADDVPPGVLTRLQRPEIRGEYRNQAEFVKDLEKVVAAEDLESAKSRILLRASKQLREDAEAYRNVEELIRQVTLAVRRKRTDPVRIRGFIDALSKTPEERAYAIGELYQSGAIVIPYLVEALRATKDPAERLPLLQALRKLSHDTVPPLLATLQSNDVQLKEDVLDILFKNHLRSANIITPHLWFLSANPAEAPSVRRKATEMLSVYLATPPDRLPSARTELTREADRFYRRQVRFPNPDFVEVWRWDGKGVVLGWPSAPTVPATQAEEYWGLHFARQALTLDPTYRPAQVLFLSLAIEKGIDRGGVTLPLSKTDPRVHDLIAKSSPELVLAVFDRALAENRYPLLLEVVRNLRERSEVLATRPGGTGMSPLTRALFVPDRRVQMAAAEATLATPGTPVPVAQTRVVDIFRRALAAQPGDKARPKVLIGYFAEEYRDKIGELVLAAGLEPVKVATGRDLVRRLNQAADIDLILADADLPDPGLAGLLAQVRADRNGGSIPIILTVTPPREPLQPGKKARFYLPGAEPPPDREDGIRRFVERYPDVSVMALSAALSPKGLQGALRQRIADPNNPALTAAELADHGERAARTLGALAQNNPPDFDIRPAATAILEALRAGRFTPEGQIALTAAAGRLPGAQPQIDLAWVLQNGERPAAVRRAAGEELVRNIQRQGVMLTGGQVLPLRDLAADRNLDPRVRRQLAVVLGSLRPGDRLTGERLREFRVEPGRPAPKEKEKEEAPPPPKKEPDKEKE